MNIRTRSIIGIMHGDRCKSIRCHWYGYLDNNGRILLNHYDSAKTNHLVSLGNLSCLGTEIGEKHKFDGRDSNKWCMFYGRDNGDTDVDFRVNTTFETFLNRVDQYDAEYYYIMKDGVWYCGDTIEGSPMYRRLVPLADALAAKDLASIQISNVFPVLA